MKASPYRFWFFLGILCVVLDQTTKLFAERFLQKPLEVLPFLDLVLVYNKGFAFGFWQNKEGLFKIFFYYLIPIVVLTTIVIFSLKVKDKISKFSFTLIIGGGVGNLIDRISYGKVRDFIDFHIGNWHYPAFNIADICVTLGILILFSEFLIKRKPKKV
jgi:signal peptidase II